MKLKKNLKKLKQNMITYYKSKNNTAPNNLATTQKNPGSQQEYPSNQFWFIFAWIIKN